VETRNDRVNVGYTKSTPKAYVCATAIEREECDIAVVTSTTATNSELRLQLQHQYRSLNGRFLEAQEVIGVLLLLRHQLCHCSLLLIYRPQEDEMLSWPS